MANYHRLAKIALILSVLVIMLGAYTRLTDAGLGCPDWPGCYGRMVLPNAQPELGAAQQAYPDQPIMAHKAWTEMVHRYAAGTLGVLILALAVWSIIRWRQHVLQPRVTPFLLVAVLIFQAVLGMWTVTLKLLPLVVTGHLLGGMAIAGLLAWLVMASKQERSYQDGAMLQDNGVELSLDVSSCQRNPRLRSAASTNRAVKVDVSLRWHDMLREGRMLPRLIAVGLIILVIQLFLGAWTSTNYAALACGADFPTCQGAWWPAMDWHHALNIFNPVGPNYEGGRLTMLARVTIQMLHRYWALITFIYLGAIAMILLTIKPFASLRKLAVCLAILLCLQVLLGILNVVKLLPLPIAVAHNGVAVLLLITVVALLQRSRASFHTAELV